MDAWRPSMQENGKDISIAPKTHFVYILQIQDIRSASKMIKMNDLRFLTYQNLLQETEVNKHVHNHKNERIFLKHNKQVQNVLLTNSTSFVAFYVKPL
ncbi:hypothetical protein CTI12_AA536120 [Artemisia annua]|uniref:Uncharacterized protein n=1 Tax=Artemisia annua TaxID=35608 RepID=A0A2U1L2Z9_ARTAN|nr:hypothetical protein CTI12_AA536120 [Artemisia annua]